MGTIAGVTHDVGRMAGSRVGERELIVPRGVGRGRGDRSPLLDVVSVMKGNRRVSEWSVVGGELPGDGDVVPDVLLLRRGSRGNCSRDADVADRELRALRAGMGTIAGVTHDVGRMAGSRVGERELIVPRGVGRGRGDRSPLLDVVSVMKGNRHVSEWSVVGGELPADGDVVPDVLLMRRGSRGNCSRDADVADRELR